MTMNEYVGKICPYCKTLLTEDDEIVICCVCDMPHHKDCWIENQGCTTFGCSGTLKAADGSMSSVTSKTMELDDFSEISERIFCTRCGAENLSSSLFCCKCGNSLQFIAGQNKRDYSPSASLNPSQNLYAAYGHPYSEYTSNIYYRNQYETANIDSEAAIYIGPKSEYYIPKFLDLKIKNKKTSWNWCAFLVAPYWMVYRKMYAYGAAVLGGAFILSFFGFFGSLLNVGGCVALGIFGNYIYMLQVEANIAHGKHIGVFNKSAFIHKASGVNTTATLLTIVGYTVLIMIIHFA